MSDLVPPSHSAERWSSHSEARVVIAVARFSGGPGRKAEAAEAWAFELTYYFLRRVGEQPQVSYENGVYTCTGLMTTTHPGDTSPVTVFDATAEPWKLDYSTNSERRKHLRALYKGPRWGGE